jgi:hypothetical protein
MRSSNAQFPCEEEAPDIAIRDRHGQMIHGQHLYEMYPPRATVVVTYPVAMRIFVFLPPYSRPIQLCAFGWHEGVNRSEIKGEGAIVATLSRPIQRKIVIYFALKVVSMSVP